MEQKQAFSLLEIGALSIGTGIAALALFPASALYGGFFLLSGCVSVGLYATNYSKFDRLWKNLNLVKGGSYPRWKDTKVTETSEIYKFTLPTGLSSEDFERNKLAIEQFLGCEIDIKYTYKELYIEVFTHKLKSTYPYAFCQCKGNVEFPVGYNRAGKLVTCDLSSGEPHLLIAGETGSGKSTILRTIITNLVLSNKVKLHLIDLKRGAEFQIFSRCKQVVNFSRTRAEAEQTLNRISTEIDRRYDAFQARDCVDIKEYNRKVGNMGYEVLVIDEFADLQSQKSSIALLEEICAKARACGIHVVISTQRPDHQVLNGRIKANVTTVLGLKTTNEVNSRIILDDTGLEALSEPGQGIFKRGTYKDMVQCLYLPTEKARELLRPHYIEKIAEQPPRNGTVRDFAFLEVI